MKLYRIGPEGFYVVRDDDGGARVLYSDPFDEPSHAWRFGRSVDLAAAARLPPVRPGKIIGIGRNFRAHAEELGNPVPAEPLIFLKATSAVIGPNAPIVLPPESERVEHEGEIAVVLGRRLRHADAETAATAVLGVTAACDVTARDLQRRDPTFARAKSFDTFCPLGPAVWVDAPLGELEVVTRVNGTERQRGHSRDMLVPIPELLAYVSRIMTLEPEDVVLTGSPAGIGPLAPEDVVTVEIRGLEPLENPVVAARRPR